LHEATVGAGLPIIDTIKKLQESGDEILRIEGCPSGTLGYLFGELGRGTSFSSALRSAMKVGYTEPDPREDLSGMDVARKALILGRLLGFEGDLDAVEVESLVPPGFRDVSVDDFVARLEEMDASWSERVEKARAAESVLRYRATVSAASVHVGLVGVTLGSSFATLTGTDNQFAITTARYRTNPIVITGPGAGVAVTAAGVLNDVLKLAGSR
jgi:aspartokinase/homoserine dehydrogenase 1